MATEFNADQQAEVQQLIDAAYNRGVAYNESLAMNALAEVRQKLDGSIGNAESVRGRAAWNAMTSGEDAKKIESNKAEARWYDGRADGMMHAQDKIVAKLHEIQRGNK